MKNIRSLSNRLVLATAVILLAGMTGNVAAETIKQSSGKVTRIKGAARYSTDNRTWIPLKVGTELKPGGVVQTASDSYVDIVFGEREFASPESVAGTLIYNRGADQASNVIRVMADSILAVDKLTVAETGVDQITETQLDLRAGRIMGNVKKLSAASKYEVKFPNGVAGIRGTIFELTAEGVVRVVEGAVVVAYVKDGTVVTQVVVAGQQWDPAIGITAIPEPTQRRLAEAATESGPGLYKVPTQVTVDNTVIHVSPTAGEAANGGAGSGE